MPQVRSVWDVVADHCNALPDDGADKMPVFAKALRALLARHGTTIDPEDTYRSLSYHLRECEDGQCNSASAAVRAIEAGIPEDEVMALVYLIF
jgi:hypothetical protein